MKSRWFAVEKMLLLSVVFTILVIVFRMLYWHEMLFLFYGWNLFLAAIPVFVSRSLQRYKNFSYKVLPGLCLWLLFLPNAPYIITDIFHFYERPPVPKWYDLLLVTSAAWNGLMLGIISLLQVEEFLKKHLAEWKVNIIITSSIIASAYGIYIGRYFRFNSWDVFTNTGFILRKMAYPFLHPTHHVSMWSFTILFGAMLWLVYFTLKKIPAGLAVKSFTDKK